MAFIAPIPLASSSLRGIPATADKNAKRKRTFMLPNTIRPSRYVCTASPISNSQSSQTETLVDELLEGIKNTNFGQRVPKDRRERLNNIFEQLVTIGKSQAPMQDPRLFGKYQVAYTSTSDKNPPAGGRYRSLLGQFLLPTRGLFQHVLQPNTIINLVCFRVLGLLNGSVSLRGELKPLDDSELGPNGVQVMFERPRICFWKAVFQMGPLTQVKLRTVYLDDRVRLAIGSRGSYFVFARSEVAESDMANEYKHIYQAKPLPPVLLSLPAVAVVSATLFANPTFRFLGIGLLMMFFAVLRKGGTVNRGDNIVPDKK